MMFYYSYSLAELKAKPEIAFKGAVVCDTNSKERTRYLIKDVVDNVPILIEIGNNSYTELPNWVGDYMLNLRTGYISLIDKDYKVTDPINNKPLNSVALSALREEYLP